MSSLYSRIVLVMLMGFVAGCGSVVEVQGHRIHLSNVEAENIATLRADLAKQPVGYQRCRAAEANLGTYRLKAAQKGVNGSTSGNNPTDGKSGWSQARQLVLAEACADAFTKRVQTYSILQEQTKSLSMAVCEAANLASAIRGVSDYFSDSASLLLNSIETATQFCSQDARPESFTHSLRTMTEIEVGIRQATETHAAATAAEATVRAALLSLVDEFARLRTSVESEGLLCRNQNEERAREWRECTGNGALRAADGSDTFTNAASTAVWLSPNQVSEVLQVSPEHRDDEFVRLERRKRIGEFISSESNPVYLSAVLVPTNIFNFSRMEYAIRLPAVIDSPDSPSNLSCSEGFACSLGGDEYGLPSDYDVFGYFVTTLRPGSSNLSPQGFRRSLGGSRKLTISIDSVERAHQVREAGGFILLSLWTPVSYWETKVREMVGRRGNLRPFYSRVFGFAAHVVAQQIRHPVDFSVVWQSHPGAAGVVSDAKCKKYHPDVESGLQFFLKSALATGDRKIGHFESLPSHWTTPPPWIQMSGSRPVSASEPIGLSDCDPIGKRLAGVAEAGMLLERRMPVHFKSQ